MEDFKIILILMVVIWVFGRIFRILSLPIIFGELLGGIIVGPSVLGLVSADNHTVELLAELGVFFMMFHAGLETNPQQLLKASRKSILIAIGGALLPFVGGYFVAQAFGSNFEESLFIAMGLSITAIVISVRLFKEYGIQNTEVARITLGAAIIDDILALILFSVVLNIAEVGSIEISNLIWILLKTALFFGVIFFAGCKTSHYLPKILKKKGFTFALIAALTLGLIAELIGLHIIIGAFLAGLFIRQEIVSEKVFNKIEDRIYGLSYSFLGPIFFVSLAFHLNWESLQFSPYYLIAILVVSILGKLIGSGAMAYFQKMNLLKSSIVGLAMNSRGAVELIIASIGIKKGIIGEEAFSILVIMAFVTTILSIFAMKPLAKMLRKT